MDLSRAFSLILGLAEQPAVWLGHDRECLENMKGVVTLILFYSRNKSETVTVLAPPAKDGKHHLNMELLQGGASTVTVSLLFLL